MEKIVKTTYKVPVIEYENGWKGTAEMDKIEFESFDKAALIELLCHYILREVIDDCIDYDNELIDSIWDSVQNNIKRFIKNNTIVSELFPIVKLDEIERSKYDRITAFSMVLSRNIDPVTCECLYFTFEV